MDYYESVMLHYLRADRALFLNTECCIQINKSDNPDTSGPHWYCDAVAVDFRQSAIFLCEISYSNRLQDLTKRLRDWNAHWGQLVSGLVRDSCLPSDWPVRPWLFVPGEEPLKLLLRRLDGIQLQFVPRITTLDAILPWTFNSWNRVGEKKKSADIPVEMQL